MATDLIASIGLGCHHFSELTADYESFKSRLAPSCARRECDSFDATERNLVEKRKIALAIEETVELFFPHFLS